MLNPLWQSDSFKRPDQSTQNRAAEHKPKHPIPYHLPQNTQCIGAAGGSLSSIPSPPPYPSTNPATSAQKCQPPPPTSCNHPPPQPHPPLNTPTSSTPSPPPSTATTHPSPPQTRRRNGKPVCSSWSSSLRWSSCRMRASTLGGSSLIGVRCVRFCPPSLLPFFVFYFLFSCASGACGACSWDLYCLLDLDGFWKVILLMDCVFAG